MNKHVMHVISCSGRNGGYGYWAPVAVSYADVSATQFAVLALREASRAGYPLGKLGDSTWKSTAEYLQRLQDSDGRFPYHAGTL